MVPDTRINTQSVRPSRPIRICLIFALGWVALGTACTPSRAHLPGPEFSTNAPSLPYQVVRGRNNGPTVAFVAGVHGGKVAAVHAIESLQRSLAGNLVRGRVILVAPANLAGYRAGLAQISPDDSLNLNRVFPGTADGRPTERLAFRIMREIVGKSDFLVDLHGSDGDEAVGRFAYAARPAIDARVDSAALRLATAWGVPTIVWDDAGPRTLETARFLQTAAHLSGVPAITVFEEGSTREDSVATRHFIDGAMALLAEFGMVSPRPAGATGATAPQVLPRRAVTLAPATGRWAPRVQPGAALARGELLGTLDDSTGVRTELRAEASGIVLHQRLPGTVATGTPLVILGVTTAP